MNQALALSAKISLLVFLNSIILTPHAKRVLQGV